jgi:hypothetical protein
MRALAIVHTRLRAGRCSLSMAKRHAIRDKFKLSGDGGHVAIRAPPAVTAETSM